MKQLENFTIERFRGVSNLQLRDLGRVNLLVGQNNSGKTTVLEALSCIARPLDGFHWLSIALRRSGLFGRRSRVTALKWLFPQSSDSSPLTLFENGIVVLKPNGRISITRCEAHLTELVGIMPERKVELESEDESAGEEDESAKSRGAQLTLKTKNEDGLEANKKITIWDDRGLIRREARPERSFPVATISLNDYRSDVDAAYRFSQFRKEGLYDEAIEVLRLLDPGVKEILVLSEIRGLPALFIDHKFTGLTPLSVCGDGMRRAVHIATTVPRLSGGILLVDEIETALHKSALTKVFHLLVTACKQYDVQLFATTHSLEALDAMLGVALTMPNLDLVSYRLEKRINENRAIRLDENTLAKVRNELGQEIR